MHIRFLSGLSKIHFFMVGIVILSILYFVICELFNVMEEYSDNNLSCSVVTNVYKGDAHLSLRIRYSFLGSDGIASLAGTLVDNDGRISKISRQVCFNYKRVNENYYLVNHRTMVSLQDTTENSLLANILPLFYEKPTARINFQIFPHGSDGVIFVKDDLPAFYCKLD
ncbi:hypothetical protein [Klebsiella aerogenes]|uniref:hypothetical protein n=1 Tax=Klebsiella aerogenes TaxID=548 RepID=UPI00186946F3|nr:hypothetical protein [Klebsiella aerogenes]